MRFMLLAAIIATIPAGYYTPQQAQTTLLKPATQIAWVSLPEGANRPYLQSSPAGNYQAVVQKASCRGMGKAKQRRFAAFFCAVRWVSSSDAKHTAFDANVYVRAWSSSQVCASTRSLADCPPVQVGPPLPGDPRCGIRSAECMSRAASESVRAYLKAHDLFDQLGSDCLARTAFVYACSWTDGGAVVRFVRGKTSWAVQTTVG